MIVDTTITSIKIIYENNIFWRRLVSIETCKNSSDTRCVF